MGALGDGGLGEYASLKLVDDECDGGWCRYMLRGMVVAYLSSRFPKWTAVDAALSNEGWKLITLLRLSPVVPWNVLNYALSVTGAQRCLPSVYWARDILMSGPGIWGIYFTLLCPAQNGTHAALVLGKKPHACGTLIPCLRMCITVFRKANSASHRACARLIWQALGMVSEL